MASISKKETKETTFRKDGSVSEETFTSVEISDEVVSVSVEKNTFFADEDEEEQWFKKQKEDEEEDDSIDVYMLDDDKSW
jgi:hypothetical protein